jgi:hypothetical protein
MDLKITVALIFHALLNNIGDTKSHRSIVVPQAHLRYEALLIF